MKVDLKVVVSINVASVILALTGLLSLVATLAGYL